MENEHLWETSDTDWEEWGEDKNWERIKPRKKRRIDRGSGKSGDKSSTVYSARIEAGLLMQAGAWRPADLSKTNRGTLAFTQVILFVMQPPDAGWTFTSINLQWQKIVCLSLSMKIVHVIPFCKKEKCSTFMRDNRLSNYCIKENLLFIEHPLLFFSLERVNALKENYNAEHWEAAD